MTATKVAVVGAGSFVFGPSLLSQLMVESQIEGLHIALMDPNADMLQLMAGIGKQMSLTSGANIQISQHTSRPQALEGADFVVNMAAVQLQKRFTIDEQLIRRHMPDHLITEFGGIAGISYSLRQIAFMEGLAADMKQYCPSAWLLNVANPLPRVCQAAHLLGIKTVGFCSAALQAHTFLWQLLGGNEINYPFTSATTRWEMRTAGLNHFTWILQLTDHLTGDDLLPLIHLAFSQGKTTGNPLSESIAHETGYLLAPGDNHVHDFLAPRGQKPSTAAFWHGNDEERSQQIRYMQEVSSGIRDFHDILQHPAWEQLGAFISAMTHGHRVEFEALNLINVGQIPTLSQQVFVETPCIVENFTILPQKMDLPPSVQALTDHTAHVTDTIVQAALSHDMTLLRTVVDLDPTIEDKNTGMIALKASLLAHQDLLPRYNPTHTTHLAP